MRTATHRLRRWTRREYETLVERGVFGADEHLELLDGLLVVREPQGSRHAAVLMQVQAALQRAFGSDHHVRPQLPVALDDYSEPEPDLAVVPGRPLDYFDAHPAAPVLMVEIAESSLPLDRRRKGSLYARAGIAEYWVVNLVDVVLEVYREPLRSRAARYGWRYREVSLLRRGDVVSPLRAPGVAVPVSDLLPPPR
jgi:Uma2 family endonuclease